MKQERLEEMVLLESSGELGAFRRWLLRRELARNPALRAFRNALTSLQDVAPGHTLAGIPDLPRDVRAAILAAAESTERRPATAFAYSMRWASACAAALFIAVGIRMTWQPPAATWPAPQSAHGQIAWDDAWDEQLALLKSELSESADEPAGSSTLDQELDDLAGQLLSAEGLRI